MKTLEDIKQIAYNQIEAPKDKRSYTFIFNEAEDLLSFLEQVKEKYIYRLTDFPGMPKDKLYVYAAHIRSQINVDNWHHIFIILNKDGGDSNYLHTTITTLKSHLKVWYFIHLGFIGSLRILDDSKTNYNLKDLLIPNCVVDVQETIDDCDAKKALYSSGIQFIEYQTAKNMSAKLNKYTQPIARSIKQTTFEHNFKIHYMPPPENENEETAKIIAISKNILKNEEIKQLFYKDEKYNNPKNVIIYSEDLVKIAKSIKSLQENTNINFVAIYGLVHNCDHNHQQDIASNKTEAIKNIIFALQNMIATIEQ